MSKLLLRTSRGAFVLSCTKPPLNAAFYCSGQNSTTHENVTFKVSVRSGDKENDQYNKESLLQEKALMDRFKHKGVAKCIEAGQGVLEINGKIWIVQFLLLEELPATSLLDLALQTTTTRKVKRIFKALVETVDYMHSCGISCDNFALDQIKVDVLKNEVKICNFSNAVESADFEQKSKDVFMLGNVLFALQTGRVPFESNDKNGWKRLFYSPMRFYYWQAIAQRLPGISVSFINAINAMLEAESERRITITKLLEHSFMVEN